MISHDDIRFFSTIAAAPSLAAAARLLNVSPSAVTQRLRALELRLGAHLMDRAGRQLILTGEGELMVEHGRSVLAALDLLEEELAERRGQVTGTLRLIAPLGFGRRHVAPIAAAFQRDNPRVKIELNLSDRLGGIPASSWDLAIHVGETSLTASSLLMRRLAANDRIICASPDYIVGSGGLSCPADLQQHACIALRENDEDVTLWQFRHRVTGEDDRIRIEPNLASNDGEVIRDWALAGRGIIVRSEWDVASDLRSGRLVQLLADYTLPEAPVVALIGARPLARAARTGKFLDAVAAALTPPPWRRA